MELPIEILVSVAGADPKVLGQGLFTVPGSANEFQLSGAALRAAIAETCDDVAKNLREVTDEDIAAAGGI
jgi:hypothetical protein